MWYSFAGTAHGQPLRLPTAKSRDLVNLRMSGFSWCDALYDEKLYDEQLQEDVYLRGFIASSCDGERVFPTERASTGSAGSGGSSQPHLTQRPSVGSSTSLSSTRRSITSTGPPTAGSLPQAPSPPPYTVPQYTLGRKQSERNVHGPTERPEAAEESQMRSWWEYFSAIPPGEYPVKNGFVHIDGPNSLTASIEKESSPNWASAPDIILNHPFHTRHSAMEDAHKRGVCQPCAYFFHKQDGCRQGMNCSFCHLCPRSELRRKKKDKAKALKAMRRAAEGPENGQLVRAPLTDQGSDATSLTPHTTPPTS